MFKIIQVIYQNKCEGVVNETTLNELISTNKVRKFYRPSESRWVDVNCDPIRIGAGKYNGPERRQFRKNEKEQKTDSFLSRIFRRKARPLTAQDCFEQGFSFLYNKGDFNRSIKAFELAIELDPANAKAYLNRGIAYERVNNVEQALKDYSRAIQLLPQDAKAYYMRGMLLGHDGKDSEAIADLRTSADLGYKLAIDYLTQKGIAR